MCFGLSFSPNSLSYRGSDFKLVGEGSQILWIGCGGGGGVFLLEVQYSILTSLISTCVLSYIGSREDWLLDRICESEKDALAILQ